MVVARKLERERLWSELIAALDRESLLSVARRFEVTPGDLAAALRRTRTTRKPITGEAPAGPNPADAVPPQLEAMEAMVWTELRPSAVLEAAALPAPPPPASPGATMVEHEKRYRAAIEDGSGDDYLVGSSRVDLQACKLEYSIVSPK